MVKNSIAAHNNKKSNPSLLKRRPRFSDRTVILLILSLAILARALYFYHLSTHNPSYSLAIHDSALFNELAHGVAENGLVGEKVFYIAPLYIYFLAAIYTLFGDSYLAVRIVQFILGVCTALLTYALAKKLFDRRIGAVAGVLAALYAPFLFFEGTLLGTSLVTFFLLLSIYCLVSISKGFFAFVIAFSAGLFLSLAVTGRPNLVLLLPLPVIYILLEKNRPAVKKSQSLALILIGLVIPLGLVSVHNYLAGKDPTPLTTHGGINFYIGNHEGASGAWEAPEGIEASVSAINLEESKRFAEQSLGKELTTSQVSRFWYARAFRFIVGQPIQWMMLMAKKFLLFWSSFETPLNFNYYFHQHYSWLLSVPFFNLVVVMPLALWGLIYNLPRWRQRWLLYVLIGTISLSVVLFFVSGRYRLPLLPFLIIFAAAGLAGFWQMIKIPGPRRWIWSAILLVLLVSQILYSHSRVKHSNFANDYYNLSLAHIMNENYEEAVHFAELAVEADSAYVDAYYNLGIAYLRLHEYDKSFDAFSRVVSLDPGEIGGHRNLGALLLLRGEYDQALHHLQIAVEGEPANVNSLMNLGLAFYYLQRYGESIQAWERLLEVDPGNDQARNNIRAARAAMVSRYQ